MVVVGGFVVDENECFCFVVVCNQCGMGMLK